MVANNDYIESDDDELISRLYIRVVPSIQTYPIHFCQLTVLPVDSQVDPIEDP